MFFMFFIYLFMLLFKIFLIQLYLQQYFHKLYTYLFFYRKLFTYLLTWKWPKLRCFFNKDTDYQKIYIEFMNKTAQSVWKTARLY
jgi:hypothetical protein